MCVGISYYLWRLSSAVECNNAVLCVRESFLLSEAETSTGSFSNKLNRWSFCCAAHQTYTKPIFALCTFLFIVLVFFSSEFFISRQSVLSSLAAAVVWLRVLKLTIQSPAGAKRLASSPATRNFQQSNVNHSWHADLRPDFGRLRSQKNVTLVVYVCMTKKLTENIQ